MALFSAFLIIVTLYLLPSHKTLIAVFLAGESFCGCTNFTNFISNNNLKWSVQESESRI